MSKCCGIAIVLLALGVAAGCRKEDAKATEGAAKVEPGEPSTTAPTTPPPAAGTAPRSVPTHEHMQEQFDAVIRVRDALIDGNLDRAKTEARSIVENKDEAPIASWREWIAMMRQAAGQVADAPRIEAAAAGAAELARACGQCHASHDVSPDLGAAAATSPAASGTIPHMLRHEWAAERMWEGMIGPSDARWRLGAAELAETPLASDEILANQSAAPRITDLAEQVHAIGAQAKGVPAWDARSALYGELLSTCAGCHQARPPRL